MHIPSEVCVNELSNVVKCSHEIPIYTWFSCRLRVSITDSNSTGEVKHLNLKEIRYVQR